MLILKGYSYITDKKKHLLVEIDCQPYFCFPFFLSFKKRYYAFEMFRQFCLKKMKTCVGTQSIKKKSTAHKNSPPRNGFGRHLPRAPLPKPQLPLPHYYKILFCEALENRLGGVQKKKRLGYALTEAVIFY